MKILTKLFKSESKNNSAISVLEKPLDMNKIIEEIHDTFYTEVDRLLEGAKVFNSLDTDKQSELDKSKRLKELGFINSKHVADAKLEEKRLLDLETDNQNKKDLFECINYFSFKYPNYKFITEDSVKKICAKYNLIYGSVENYIGEVPDKNLEHIEKFSINEVDECYEFSTYYMGDSSFGSYMSFEDYENRYDNGFRFLTHRSYTKSSLEIAAPLKDFDTKDMKLENFKLSKVEILDPIVLKPIYFKNKKHYLIVTAWGAEQLDELVVNQKMN